VNATKVVFVQIVIIMLAFFVFPETYRNFGR